MSEKLLLKKLFEHDERFERLDANISAGRDEYLTGQDKMMVILQRFDQERIFTNETVKRLQKNQEKQQKEIGHIKRILKVA